MVVNLLKSIQNGIERFYNQITEQMKNKLYSFATMTPLKSKKVKEKI